MSIIYLDPKDVEVLELLATLVHISSYKLSKISGIAPSTVWRILVKLKTLGLITKDDRQFSITPRGLVITYYLSSRQSIRYTALENLKEAWKYDGSTEELRSFLDSLKSFLDEHQISPMSVCFNQPLSVVTLMLPRASELKEGSKNVLARFILKAFPSVILPNGCRAVLSFNESGEPYAMAADCKDDGIHLFHKCSVISSFVKAEVKAKK
jgi:Transcriptional regulator